MDQLTMRWENREQSWAVADPAVPFRWTPEWEAAEIPDDTTARAFVERSHYSGSYAGCARFRYGLYLRGTLVGVVVFAHPTNDKSIAGIWDGLQATDGVDMARLVLSPLAPGNSESGFIGWAMRQLRREGIAAVISFSDPIPRPRLNAEHVLPGHAGIVYQSVSTVQGSSRLVGRSKARVRRFLPDGTELHARAVQKIRMKESGWEDNVARLVAAGAEPLAAGADSAAWIRRVLGSKTTPLKHPGNYKYAWGLVCSCALAPNPADYPAPAGGRVPPKWGRRAAARC